MPSTVRHAMRQSLLLILCGFALAGCEQLGLEDPAKIEAAKEAEGRAIGGACRHSGRALEDCYALNSKALKAAIFSGWRDMDAYMRENAIEVVTPTVTRPSKAPAKKKPAEETPAAEPPAKPEPEPKSPPTGKTPAAPGKQA